MNRQQRRARQRDRRRVGRGEAVDLAVMSCAIRGCTCSPDITVRHEDGVPHVGIAHDDWCPVIGEGDQ